MAKEKKPSIYADRGTIGSSEELDKYGVWIKSELQDLPNKNLGLSPKIPDDDFDSDEPEMGIPDIGDLPDFDTLEDEIDTDLPEDSYSMDVSSDDTDDFDIPQMDDDDLVSEDTTEDSDEDSDSDVFDFGDFSEQDVISDLSDSEDDLETAEDMEILEDIEIPDDINLPEDTVFPEADEDFSEISEDNFIGIDDGNSVDFADSADSADSLESGESGEAKESVESNKFNESAIFEKPGGTLAEKPAAPQDLSTQLLMKIADELSSIRTELSSLKNEFSGIKAAVPKEVKGEKGYFAAEEEDEKIALTGAELINIMNTADFTEETGKDASNELSDDDLDIHISDDDITFDDSPEDDLDIVINDTRESEDVDELEISDISEDVGELEVSDISEKDFPPDLVIEEEDLDIPGDNIPDFSENDAEELKQIREEGALPIAFAPTLEDAEYLKDDPLADSETDDEMDNGEVEDISIDFEELLDSSIDLSEAVIDEPDLSSEITDNPLEEPSMEDISINLDLSDLESDEFLEPEEIQEEPLEEIEEAEEVSGITLEEISDEPLGELLYEENADGEAGIPELEEEILLPDLPETEDLELELEELDSGETDFTEDLDSGTGPSLIPETFTVEEPEIISEETFSDDSPDSLPGSLSALEDELDILDAGEELSELVEDVQDDESLTELDAEELEVAELDLEELDSGLSEPAELQPVEPLADSDIPLKLKQELKVVLSYMDQLLESLPDEKIEEFAKSEYYDTYKKLFKELGLV